MSVEDIVKLLIKMQERGMEQASEERQSQTEAFTGALDGLRKELRLLFALAMLVLAGLSGLNATLKGWGINASVTQDQEQHVDVQPDAQHDELADPLLGSPQR